MSLISYVSKLFDFDGAPKCIKSQCFTIRTLHNGVANMYVLAINHWRSERPDIPELMRHILYCRQLRRSHHSCSNHSNRPRTDFRAADTRRPRTVPVPTAAAAAVTTTRTTRPRPDCHSGSRPQHTRRPPRVKRLIVILRGL